MQSVATFQVLFGGFTARVSRQPFHTSPVTVDGRLVQRRVSHAGFLVQVSYPVNFQKPEKYTMSAVILLHRKLVIGYATFPNKTTRVVRFSVRKNGTGIVFEFDRRIRYSVIRLHTDCYTVNGSYFVYRAQRRAIVRFERRFSNDLLSAGKTYHRQNAEFRENRL